ncbi:hypothetical protein ACTFIV_000823 [Dictyostelium citrinum]
MITNLINKYLISTRSYLSSGILFILLISSSIAYRQTGQLDIWFSLFCFTIIFQNFCFAYLLNSYLDYLTGSEYVKSEMDRTLFKHITLGQLRGFIKVPLILNLILLVITYRWKGLDTLLMIACFDLLQIIGVCIYSPSKHYAMGHLVFSFVHYINIWIFYYSNTKQFPSFNSSDPFIYYSFYFLPVILQSIHANYHRDIENDKKSGILTIAILLGGLIYLIFLMIKFNNIFFLLPFATLSLINELYGNIDLLNVQTTKIHFFSLFLFSIAILLGGKK